MQAACGWGRGGQGACRKALWRHVPQAQRGEGLAEHTNLAADKAACPLPGASSPCRSHATAGLLPSSHSPALPGHGPCRAGPPGRATRTRLAGPPSLTQFRACLPPHWARLTGKASAPLPRMAGALPLARQAPWPPWLPGDPHPYRWQRGPAPREPHARRSPGSGSPRYCVHGQEMVPTWGKW